MFKAGHTYQNRGLKSLCVASNTKTATFRTDNSFSVKRHDKKHLYIDLGVTSFKGWIYKIAGMI